MICLHSYLSISCRVLEDFQIISEYKPQSAKLYPRLSNFFNVQFFVKWTWSDRIHWAFLYEKENKGTAGKQDSTVFIVTTHTHICVETKALERLLGWI